MVALAAGTLRSHHEHAYHVACEVWRRSSEHAGRSSYGALMLHHNLQTLQKNATHVNLRLTWFQRARKRWAEWSRSSSHELKDIQDEFKTGASRDLCMLRTLYEKGDRVCGRETCEILSALLARAHVHAACVPRASVGYRQISKSIWLK